LCAPFFYSAGCSSMKIPPQATPEESKQIVKDFYKKHERNMPKAFYMKVASRTIDSDPQLAEQLSEDYISTYRPNYEEIIIPIILSQDYSLLYKEYSPYDSFFYKNNLNWSLYNQRKLIIFAEYVSAGKNLVPLSLEYFNTIKDDTLMLCIMADAFNESGHKLEGEIAVKDLLNVPDSKDINVEAFKYCTLLSFGLQKEAAVLIAKMRDEYTKEGDKKSLDALERGDTLILTPVYRTIY